MFLDVGDYGYHVVGVEAMHLDDVPHHLLRDTIGVHSFHYCGLLC